jgi:hypothetical protein
MKRFSNLFVYETTNFQGEYKNCRLLEDVYHMNSKHVFAFVGETFPTIVVDIDNSEIYFFEEFDEYVPMFTVHFKMTYI